MDKTMHVILTIIEKMMEEADAHTVEAINNNNYGANHYFAGKYHALRDLKNELTIGWE